ncbi:MAG: TonB-dependent receptor plug domain-containing protein, partial [Bacteroidaceae bacterium]|nr:TonB-dependent receptor plug domain-containing protein [Bacteroidaceae bacterium]
MKKRLLGWIMLSLMCLSSMADDISGVILKNGKPKKGITVWMKKADKAVETDKEGKFFFTNVYEGDTLQITVSAKSDAKILLRDWRQITVNLEKKKYTVNDGKSENTYEYVVLFPLRVGDGVTHEMIMRSGLRTIPDLIRNYISGVVVTSDGGSSKVQIHGISSVNSGTDPLVVLDGVALQGVDL